MFDLYNSLLDYFPIQYCIHCYFHKLVQTKALLQELEAIKARVKEMEEEAEKIREMQNAVDLKMNMSSPGLGKL